MNARGIILGLSYSLLISIFFVFLRTLGSARGEDAFLVGSLFLSVLCLLYFLFCQKEQLCFEDVFDFTTIFRGLLFGLTQFLFVISIKEGTVTNSFCASVFGVLLSFFMGGLLLGEAINRWMIFALAVSVSGCFFSGALENYSYAGLLAGALQGTNTLLVRHLNLKKKSLSITFFWAFFWIFILLAGHKYILYGSIIEVINPTQFFQFGMALATFLFLVQRFQFYCLKKLKVTQFSCLSLTRVFWVILLEGFVYGMQPLQNSLVMGLSILMGVCLLNIGYQRRVYE